MTEVCVERKRYVSISKQSFLRKWIYDGEMEAEKDQEKDRPLHKPKSNYTGNSRCQLLLYFLIRHL